MQKPLLDSNTFALVVTYNPELQVFDLLNNLLLQFNRIIIIDNNSINKIELSDYCFAHQNNITLHCNDNNLGLAFALNQGCNLGINAGYSWVVTFDQDTFVLPNLFSIIKNVYLSYNNKELIGAIGSNYLNKKVNLKTNLPYYERDYLITSGTLYSLYFLKHLGMFREDLFIDNIDIEYSLRLTLNNKKILLSKSIGMVHNPGDVIYKNFCFFNISSSNHNCLRRYYMSRNHVIIFKLFFLNRPFFLFKSTFFFFLSLVKLVLVEEDSFNKLNHSFKGLFDGIKYKLS